MKKVLFLFSEGFEEVEGLTVVDYLRRVDVSVEMVCVSDEKNVKGAHDIRVCADKTLNEVENIDDYDAIIMPGGLPNAYILRDDKRVLEIVKKYYEDKKIIGAICAAPIILEKAGILNNKKVTSYPGFESIFEKAIYSEKLIVRDENIITSRGPATAIYFALELIECLVGNKQKEQLKSEILFDLI